MLSGLSEISLCTYRSFGSIYADLESLGVRLQIFDERLDQILGVESPEPWRS